MPIEVLNVIERLSLGGASRTLLATCEFLSRTEGAMHRVHSLLPPHPAAIERAKQAGLTLVPATDFAGAAGTADIVHIHFWNTPDLYAALERTLPAARIVLTCHVGGILAPQVLTREIVDFADVVLVTSRSTIEQLGAVLAGKGVLAPDPADFSRLRTVVPTVRRSFNVGYIGTVDFAKMHPRYVEMHAAIDIPEARFIVCGEGGASAALRRKISALKAESRFDLLGYVDDIAPVLSSLDVFGYPLCEDTYATTELVLQEAQFAGLPCVVFPHGGAVETIVDGETGFVVRNEEQYIERITYLQHHRDVLARMSEAARAHARNNLGVENLAPIVGSAHRQAMTAPKHPRPPLDRLRGADAFLRSLGVTGARFRSSLRGESAVAREADVAIGKASPALANAGGGGVLHYRSHYPDDPMLRFWAGLVLLGQGRSALATAEFLSAMKLGLPRERVSQHLSEAAGAAGNSALAGRSDPEAGDAHQ